MASFGTLYCAAVNVYYKSILSFVIYKLLSVEKEEPFRMIVR